MTTIIQLRRGTASEWTAANPTLALGQAGIETNTLTWKVGDGVTDWANLSYMSGGGGNVTYGNSNVAAFLASFGSNVLATTGNITAGNVSISGVISATGNITSGAGYFIGNGSQLTNLPVQPGTYGNGNVSTFLGNLGSNAISTTGNVTADYFFGNGSQLTGITAVASTGNVTFNDVNIIGTGNLYLQPNAVQSSAYLDVYLTSGPDIHINGNGENVIVGSDSGANVQIGVDGNVSIQANTGTAQVWNFGSDGNVTVPANGWINSPIGSNGNINIHPDGNGTVNITGSNDVLLHIIGDTANTLNRVEIDTFGNVGNLGGTFTGGFSRGNITNPAAVQAGDWLAGFKGKGFDGASVLRPTGAVIIEAFENWSPGNASTRIGFYTTPVGNDQPELKMVLGANGNLFIPNGNLDVSGGGGFLRGDPITGDGGLYTGISGFTILGSNVVAQFSGNSNSYSQINFQNTSDGTQASGDFIITANNGNDSANFINVGIAGNTWDGTQPNSLGTNVGPNDGYLYVNGGDLVVGTDLSICKFSSSGAFIQPPVPYANLTAVAGARAFINNGNLVAAGNFGAQVDGSGSNTVPVWSDGTNWYIG